MEVWIIIMIIGIIIFFSNQKKPQENQQKAKRQTIPYQETMPPTKAKMISLIKGISGFKADEIIESKQSFYIFAIDKTNKKVAFVTNDLAILIMSFSDIISVGISYTNVNANNVTNNTQLFLNIKRTHFNNPLIKIECFDTAKLTNRVVSPIKNQVMLNSIYQDELSQAQRIEQILINIINSTEKSNTTTPPPPPASTKSAEVKPTAEKSVQQQPIAPVFETSERKKNIYSAKTEIGNKEDINITETVAKVNLNISERDVLNSSPEPEENISSVLQKMNELKELVVSQSESETKETIKISIEDIDNLTRGIFLDNELTSTINDARMKGLKDLYLTKEQLSRLNINQSSINENKTIGNTQTEYTDISYKPITYQTTYKDENGEK